MGRLTLKAPLNHCISKEWVSFRLHAKLTLERSIPISFLVSQEYVLMDKNILRSSFVSGFQETCCEDLRLLHYHLLIVFYWGSARFSNFQMSLKKNATVVVMEQRSCPQHLCIQAGYLAMTMALHIQNAFLKMFLAVGGRLKAPGYYLECNPPRDCSLIRRVTQQKKCRVTCLNVVMG